MALETSGFQLSQFERAPQIPGNIGVVDTKSIYGSVVDALKANEALRTTQAVQAATDAELALAQQKAQTEMGLLGPEAEARRAKAELLSAEAPYQMGLLRPKALATRTGLEAETIRNRILAEPATARQVIEGKTLTPAVRTQVQLQALLNRGGLNEEESAAIKAKLGQTLTLAEQAKLQANLNKVHEKVVDGQVIQFTNSGAVRIPGQTDWSFGPTVSTGASPMVPVVPTGGAGVLAAPVPTMTGAPLAGGMGAQGLGTGAGRGLLGGESASAKREAVTQQKYGQDTLLSQIPGEEAQKATINYGNELLKDAQKSVRTQQKNLSTFATEAKADDEAIKAIDELTAMAKDSGILVSGGSFIGRGARALLPEQRAAFESRLASVVQRIQLGNMLKLKNASATGATGFGNLTESEGELLRADYGIFSNPNLSTDQIVAGLERAKNGMLQRRQDALNTIQEELQRARSEEMNGARIVTNESPIAMQRLMLARHSGEPAPEEAAPAPAETPAAEPSAQARAIFPSSGSLAPARITLGAAPVNRAEGPHTAGPLVPVEAEPAAPTTSKYEQVPAGTPTVSSYPGRVVQPAAPAPAPAPAAPAPAPAPAPERAPNAPASPLLVDFVNRLREVNPEVVRRRQETAAQVGGTGYAAAGPFAKPAEPAQPAVAPASKYSWEQYNARRQRTTEQTGLPQISLSPQGVGIARELRSQYEAGQRAKQSEQPVVEITASDGKRRAFAVEDPEIADMLIGILTGQQPPNLEPRLEVDREATRRLGEERMRREEMARQLRSMPRR